MNPLLHVLLRAVLAIGLLVGCQRGVVTRGPVQSGSTASLAASQPADGTSVRLQFGSYFHYWYQGGLHEGGLSEGIVLERNGTFKHEGGTSWCDYGRGWEGVGHYRFDGRHLILSYTRHPDAPDSAIITRRSIYATKPHVDITYTGPADSSDVKIRCRTLVLGTADSILGVDILVTSNGGRRLIKHEATDEHGWCGVSTKRGDKLMLPLTVKTIHIEFCNYQCTLTEARDATLIFYLAKEEEPNGFKPPYYLNPQVDSIRVVAQKADTVWLQSTYPGAKVQAFHWRPKSKDD